MALLRGRKPEGSVGTRTGPPLAALGTWEDEGVPVSSVH